MAQELTPEQLARLLQLAGKRLGTDPETLRRTLESGKTDDLLKNAGKQQNPLLKQILSNPAAASKLMESPQLREMMKKLMEG